MPNPDDWRDAYRHLIAELERIGADGSVVLAVQEAAAARHTISEHEALAPVEGAKALTKADQQAISRLRSRPPTPREAFTAAVEALSARLVEAPAVTERLTDLLDRDADSIRWLPDASESDFEAPQESFAASQLVLSPDERAQINAALTTLTDLLPHDGDSQ